MIEIENRKNDRLKIVQFILSLIAFLVTTICAASCFAGGTLFHTTLGFSEEEGREILAFGSICILLSAVHFSALINALKSPSISNIPFQTKNKSFLFASIAMAVWAIFLALNYFHIAQQFLLVIQPYLTPLVVCIPIWWFIELGKRNLPPLTIRKKTAALSLGSSYIVLFILLLELIIFALIIAGFLVYLNFQPFYKQFLQTFTIPQNLSQLDTQFLEHYLLTFLQNPWVIVGIFLLIGIIAPFIEESLKPAALWALRKRSLSPAQGFVLGLYFGAAFAFIESSGMLIQLGAEEWVENILLRSATSLLHITCSGLVGYGYAYSIFSERKGSLFKYLCLATLLHGMWNSLAVFYSLASLSQENAGGLLSPVWETVSIIALILEWVFILFFLWKKNKRINDEIQNELHRKDESRVAMNEVE